MALCMEMTRPEYKKDAQPFFLSFLLSKGALKSMHTGNAIGQVLWMLQTLSNIISLDEFPLLLEMSVAGVANPTRHKSSEAKFPTGHDLVG